MPPIFLRLIVHKLFTIKSIDIVTQVCYNIDTVKNNTDHERR